LRTARGLPRGGAGLERGAAGDPPEGPACRIKSPGTPLAAAEPVVDLVDPGEEPPAGEHPEPLTCRPPFSPGDLLPRPIELATGPPLPQEDPAHSQDRQQKDRGQCSGPWASSTRHGRARVSHPRVPAFHSSRGMLPHIL